MRGSSVVRGSSWSFRFLSVFFPFHHFLSFEGFQRAVNCSQEFHKTRKRWKRTEANSWFIWINLARAFLGTAEESSWSSCSSPSSSFPFPKIIMIILFFLLLFCLSCSISPSWWWWSYWWWTLQRSSRSSCSFPFLSFLFISLCFIASCSICRPWWWPSCCWCTLSSASCRSSFC